MGAKVVVFVDALDPRSAAGFLHDIMEGSYRCDFPCVTPTNIGSILTGHMPGKHGLVSPTRWERPAVQKPVLETVIERVARRMRVLSHGIPFTAGIHLEKGVSGDGGGTDDEPVAVAPLVFPRIPIDMGHVDPTKALQAWMDSASSLFATFRQFVRNGVADVYFIGYRNLDSFTHWHQDGPWYTKLQEHVGAELKAFTQMGNDIDLLVFSDHGSMPATELFRLNLWLMEKGMLGYNALWKNFNSRLKRQKEANPERTPYWHQIGPYCQEVEITEESRFINADAFDSCIDAIGKDVQEKEIQDLCVELQKTGFFEGVYTREELYPGLSAEEYDRLPHIIPHRKPGVLVSSNLYPGLPITGFTDHEEIMNRRNGDHWPEGYYGCTGESPYLGDLDGPQELCLLIDRFCGDLPGEDKKTDGYSEQEAAKVADRLAQLGYM